MKVVSLCLGLGRMLPLKDDAQFYAVESAFSIENIYLRRASDRRVFRGVDVGALPHWNHGADRQDDGLGDAEGTWDLW